MTHVDNFGGSSTAGDIPTNLADDRSDFLGACLAFLSVPHRMRVCLTFLRRAGVRVRKRKSASSHRCGPTFNSPRPHRLFISSTPDRSPDCTSCESGASSCHGVSMADQHLRTSLSRQRQRASRVFLTVAAASEPRGLPARTAAAWRCGGLSRRGPCRRLRPTSASLLSGKTMGGTGIGNIPLAAAPRSHVMRLSHVMRISRGPRRPRGRRRSHWAAATPLGGGDLTGLRRSQWLW